MNAISPWATLDYSKLSRQGTSIAWTFWPGSKGETWTVLRGCKWAKTGTGVAYETCIGCYAQRTAGSLVDRFDSPHYRGLTKKTKRGHIWNGKVNFDLEQLEWPLACDKPRTFFLTSMGDLFYQGVTDDQIAQILAVMVVAMRHRFLVLTKRPHRMQKLLRDGKFLALVLHYVAKRLAPAAALMDDVKAALFKGNIWWGTSIENWVTAHWAIHQLVKVPATGRRWISFEPMIEYVDLAPYIHLLSWVVLGGGSKQTHEDPPVYNVTDANKVIDLCRRQNVAVFQKQLGSRPVWTGASGKIIPLKLPKQDNHNADPQHWPAHLQVQEFPIKRAA